MSQEKLLGLLGERKVGALVTLKRDGRPQLSNVMYAYVPEERTAYVSVTADRAKTRNLERDPRASLHVSSADGWAWTVVEGTAELSGVATEPHDDAVDELVGLYRRLAGEHPEWDEYRAAMIAERRRVVRLRIEHVYGQAKS